MEELDSLCPNIEESPRPSAMTCVDEKIDSASTYAEPELEALVGKDDANDLLMFGNRRNDWRDFIRNSPLCALICSSCGLLFILFSLGLLLLVNQQCRTTKFSDVGLLAANTSEIYDFDPVTLSVVSNNVLINASELDLQTGFHVLRKPAVREYEFNITRALGSPDGFRKPMIVINGQSPGPLLEANTGDTVRVRVNNWLANDSTTIHWHGINQLNSSWMDGVAGVSQCGIPPGRSFTYEFRLDGLRGTFWYHSHLAVQYADGLYGPIVIHDPDEQVPPVDDDKIIFLGDLYHASASRLRSSYLRPTSPWSPHMPGVEPLADNLVMNGQSMCDCSVVSTTMAPAPPAENQTVVCESGSVYTTQVRPGHRLRLRLINHSSFFSYWFSVDGHTLTIIEIDGVEVEPLVVTGVYVNIGQRCSVILVADRPAARYRLRANLVRTCFLPFATYRSSGLEQSGFGVQGELVYDDGGGSAGNNGPATEDSSASAWNETNVSGAESNPFNHLVWEGCNDLPFDQLQPMRRMPAHTASEANSHYIEFEFRQAQEVNRIFVNKTAFSVLADNATIWKVAQQDFSPSKAGSYNSWDFGLNQQALLFVEPNAGAQLVINSLDDMEHPWHLHGHTFQVVGWGAGLFGSGKTTWRLANPMRRDTVTVPANSHVVLRFRTDNPGLWAVHCHVAWHQEAGMLLSIVERPVDLVDLLERLDPAVRELSQSFCAYTA